MNGDVVFLDAAILICVLMTFVNLARAKSRGNSAYYLGSAFLVLGGTIYAYLSQAPNAVIGLGGAIVFVLLVCDFVYRARRPQ